MLQSGFRSLAIALLLTGGVAPAGGSLPVASAESRLAEPEIFSQAGLVADRTAAVDAGKVHIVYATATWCPPCKKMKAETWIDEDVVAWANANAVVTPLDIDRNETEARRYRVRSIPTIMVFDTNGGELGRTVGYQSPSQFRSWLESSTGRGMPTTDANESSASAPASRASVQDKLVLAQDAVQAGRLDEAAEAYAWLWDNMRQDRAADELRRGRLSDQIESLIMQHDAARTPFAERRDRIGSSLPARDADDGVLLDWLTLNDVLDEQQLSLDWVGSAIDDRRNLGFMRKHQQIFRPMLTESGRWNDAAVIVNNPFAAARLELMELKKSQRQTGASGIDDTTLHALADLYAIGHTIDRAGFAERVSSLVLRTEDTPAIRRTLVSRAIDAGYTKPSLAELLADDGSDEAQALRAQLDG